jgi:hypothetical protein
LYDRTRRATGLDALDHVGASLARQWQARHAHAFGAASHDLLGELDGLHEIVIGVEME